METAREPRTITTSTRDLADLRQRLQAWLATQLPAEAEPRVTELTKPDGNGMSSETLLFDATWRDSGTDRQRPLVARVAPDTTNVPVFPAYDMAGQFAVMRLVAAAGTVPVPTPLWCEPDPAHLGSPFFVMERMTGQVPPDSPPYAMGGWVTEASPEQRSRLQQASIAVLARIHTIDGLEAASSFLSPPRPEPTALRQHVGAQRDYYEWVAQQVRSPLIERTFDWLEEHWPAEESPAALSWGDARIGNIMYDDFTPVAVLDWEMAGIAPREVDLGWFIYLHRFFDDLAVGYGLPGVPGFLRRDDVVATYAALTGHTPRDLDFYTMYAALRHAIVMMRIKFRSVHFGEDSMPADVDDMILHRTTLEAMLAGTYWTDPVGPER